MNVSGLLHNKGAEVLCLKKEDTIAEAVAMLNEKKIGATVVLDSDKNLQGILSERDIVRELAIQGADLLNKSVADVMTSNVQTCAPSDPVSKIMAQMSEGRFRHLPVLDNDKLVGIVSIGDVIKNRIQELEYEANAMREYITTG